MVRRGGGEPKRLGEVLAELAASSGYGRVLATAEWEVAWRRVVGSEIAAQTAVKLPRAGRVEVVVTHPVLLQELSFRKEELIAALRRELPHQKVHDIRFRLGVLD